ncbi:MAG: hypothetical protein E7374_03905 [Clostridiales bacterium]|nr:hypothetical protein [Clostridiales bacterium]
MRKILLLLCIAFVVVCYAYPCLICPFGEYENKTTVGNVTTTSTLKFNFNGKVEQTTQVGDSKAQKTEYYYKLKKDNKVAIYEDKDCKNEIVRMNIDSIYELNFLTEYKNNVGFYTAIGVGVLAVLLVLWPSKK